MVFYVLIVCIGVASAFSDLSNVALYKPANQSSDETPDFTASSAVDGISESDLFSKSCSSTYSWDPLITHAWWMVDLLKDYRIESITIQNRGDCCGERLKNLEIKIAKTDGDFNRRASFQGPGTNDSYHEFEIGNFIGRYVRLETTSESSAIPHPTFSQAILTLCEVQVFGRNIARDASFTISPETKSNAGVLKEMVTPSDRICVFYCLRLSGCVAVNYREGFSGSPNCHLMDGVGPQEHATGHKLIVSQ